MLNRIDRFNHLDSFLNALSKDEICSLGKVFQNPTSFGSTSANASAYRIQINSSTKMAAKIMKNNARNRQEIDWYHHFMERFADLSIPHFPFISRYENCNVCSITKTYNNKDWINSVVAENCIVLFSELADGDLKSAVTTLKNNEDALRSMICQVLMALLVLEQEGIVHNDLHFGNLLYHNESVDIVYPELIENVQIVIPSEGKVWVLWDFGMMVRNGDQDPRDDGAIVNTFVNDWKITFIPLLHKNFPSSPFVNEIIEKTKTSSSIAEVIDKI